MNDETQKFVELIHKAWEHGYEAGEEYILACEVGVGRAPIPKNTAWAEFEAIALEAFTEIARARLEGMKP